MNFVVAGSGAICAMMFALGFGLVMPVSSVMSGIYNLVAVASGMVFCGLLDGE